MRYDHENPNAADLPDGEAPAAAADAAAAGGGEAAPTAGKEGEAPAAPAATADEPAAPAAQSAEDEAAAVLAVIDQVQTGETAAAKADGDAAAAGDGAAAGEGGDPAKPAKEGEDDDPVGKQAEAEAEKLGIKNEAANAKFKEMYRQVQGIPEIQARAERGDELFGAIQQSGATGEQFGTALMYIEAVNTGDLGKLAQAHEWLQQELAWLGEKLGKPKAGADPLEGHDDLRASVEAGDMTATAAAELANLRNGQKLQQRVAEQRRESTQQSNAIEQATEAARQEINALGAGLIAAEQTPEAKAHVQALLDQVIAGERARILKLPPTQWATEIELAFLRAKQKSPPPQPKPEPKPAPRVAPQPLRPIGGVSQPVKAPTTEMEAIDAGIAMANAGGSGFGY